MPNGADFWQISFFAAAGLLVLLQAWHGWKLGVVRQVLNVVALGAGYVAGFYGGEIALPILRPLILPDQILRVAGGILVGLLVYLAIWSIAALVFKKTADQKIGLIRFGYGAMGALIGALFGLFLVWVAILGIRLVGTVAETEMKMAAHRAASNRGAPTPPPASAPPNAVIRGLAHMKNSLEKGRTGAVVQQIDPIPGNLYSTLSKLGQMVSNEQTVNRFLSYPGVKNLTANPKVMALQNDASIAKALRSHDYAGLLRNEHIVAVANDPEIAATIRKMEFEKALNYALGISEGGSQKSEVRSQKSE